MTVNMETIATAMKMKNKMTMTMKMTTTTIANMRLPILILLSAAVVVPSASAFAPPQLPKLSKPCPAAIATEEAQHLMLSWRLYVEKSSGNANGGAGGEEKEEEKSFNPYADPNYPDLEFVNYDDPEYAVDQGGNEIFDSSRNTEEEIEAMREDRRRRNDEFQFETYFSKLLQNGDDFKGEWMVYQTSTFMDGLDDADTNADGDVFPRVAMAGEPLKVISRAERIELERPDGAAATVEDARIVHYEKVWIDEDGDDSGENGKPGLSPEKMRVWEEIMTKTYWPEKLSAIDFRGPQGVMCVGNAYTLSDATPLNGKSHGSNEKEGPYSDYRAEVGIQKDLMRFRIKLNYSIAKQDAHLVAPPLRLRSLVVCRETQGMWPRTKKYTSKAAQMTAKALFGPPGAPGGLYDPPPVGSEQQASQYMLLDLEGGATVLFPYKMDQEDGENTPGWVMSLDWTPGDIRLQVDRKIMGGKNLLGLRTLELSEVQSSHADRYRPRDGGKDMRQ